MMMVYVLGVEGNAAAVNGDKQSESIGERRIRGKKRNTNWLHTELGHQSEIMLTRKIK